ncbi:hypothetical protein CN679_22790 [Bacillus pseudomycoides]|uniref:tyrosine-type recombinase/integrase n=1 Tax=Bacillus pseudomycoides TaxID=64104 RepID=UPI000BF0834E|nr:tyrosine-type recombinase/integrase [Bacillus pseudomycoides]PEI87120.1 hypothetical protein CN679_22790 [Bacillus pseudomycoides]
MTQNSLSLQPITRERDYSNLFIGTSSFLDDTWDLSSFITAKTRKGSQKYISFHFIKNGEIKQIVKQYAYHKLGQIKPQTVRNDINSSLPSFIEYCDVNNIKLFSEVTKEHFLQYALWLKEEKKVASHTGYTSSKVVEEIIKLGQIKGWDMPNENLFLDVNSMDLWQPQKNRQEKKILPIPDDVFDKILYYAVNKENNVLTKAGIIIQSQTGLRINEVLSIKQGCVHTTRDGHDYMEVTLSKTEKGNPIVHKAFINELVKKAIVELEEFTAPLREESGLKELFLIRYQGIRSLNVAKWGENRLPNFIKRWDIRDNKGNLYPLKSHQFRSTFVRTLVKKNVPIAHIMKQFAHVSIEMTSHYLTLQAEEVNEILVDKIFRQDSKIAGIKAMDIKNTLNEQFRGKTEQEIDTVVSNLSKSMILNPLPTGVCIHDTRRGDCSDGDGCFFYNCPNYVTEVEFYPVLKKELDLLEAEMARFKALERERDWQRLYVKHKFLKPLVDSLEAQMNE